MHLHVYSSGMNARIWMNIACALKLRFQNFVSVRKRKPLSTFVRNAFEKLKKKNACNILFDKLQINRFTYRLKLSPHKCRLFFSHVMCADNCYFLSFLSKKCKKIIYLVVWLLIIIIGETCMIINISISPPGWLAIFSSRKCNVQQLYALSMWVVIRSTAWRKMFKWMRCTQSKVSHHYNA